MRGTGRNGIGLPNPANPLSTTIFPIDRPAERMVLSYGCLARWTSSHVNSLKIDLRDTGEPPSRFEWTLIFRCRLPNFNSSALPYLSSAGPEKSSVISEGGAV